MIIVEVFVPSIDKTYEFKVNEDIAAGVVMDEICSVICQKEQCAVKGDKASLMMIRMDRRQELSTNLSLFENGVQSGDTLMLV